MGALNWIPVVAITAVGDGGLVAKLRLMITHTHTHTHTLPKRIGKDFLFTQQSFLGRTQ